MSDAAVEVGAGAGELGLESRSQRGASRAGLGQFGVRDLDAVSRLRENLFKGGRAVHSQYVVCFLTGGYVSALLPVQEPSEVMCSPALQATAMLVVSCGHKVTDEEL